MTELADAAELLASELVTNAQRHTDSAYSFRLRPVGPDRLRLAVWDSNPYIPAPFAGPPGKVGPAADTAEDGRGMQLIQTCADRWGGYPLAGARTGWPGGGKLLWAECGRRGQAW